MNNNLSHWADIISLISGVMTVLGIGGLFSYSVFRKESTSSSILILKIFSYSVKLFISIMFGLIVYLISSISWINLVDLIGGDSYVPDVTYFQKIFGFGNLWGTLIIGLFAIPLLLLGISCIFLWSFKPLNNFISVFKNQSNNDEKRSDS